MEESRLHSVALPSLGASSCAMEITWIDSGECLGTTLIQQFQKEMGVFIFI